MRMRRRTDWHTLTLAVLFCAGWALVFWMFIEELAR